MKLIKTSKIHQNQRFIVKEDIVQHPENITKTYQYVLKNNACLIIVIFESKVGLLATARYIVNEEESYELIGGKIEDNETPEDCIKRELEEEANIKTKVVNHFFDTYPLPSLTTEKVSVFTVEIERLENIRLDKNELLQKLIFVSLGELEQMLKMNQIKSSVDCLALYKYLFTKIEK